MNNYWVTNFRASQEGEFNWSYFLSSVDDPSNTTATRMGWSSSIPLLGRVFPSGQVSDKSLERSLLHIDADNILLVGSKPAYDGKGIILHFRETEGRSAEFSVSIPALPSTRINIREVNALEEKIGESSLTIKLRAWESRFFKIEFE
jgi:alpha-mannosidase